MSVAPLGKELQPDAAQMAHNEIKIDGEEKYPHDGARAARGAPRPREAWHRLRPTAPAPDDTDEPNPFECRLWPIAS